MVDHPQTVWYWARQFKAELNKSIWEPTRDRVRVSQYGTLTACPNKCDHHSFPCSREGRAAMKATMIGMVFIRIPLPPICGKIFNVIRQRLIICMSHPYTTSLHVYTWYGTFYHHWLRYYGSPRSPNRENAIWWRLEIHENRFRAQNHTFWFTKWCIGTVGHWIYCTEAIR